MTIASKKTMLTAAVTVGVLAASGTATPTGQAPISSTPPTHLAIPSGPTLAAFVTPNTLFAAAVSSLPAATSGATSTPTGTSAPVVAAVVDGAATSSGPAVVAQSGPNLAAPTIFART